MRLSELLYQSRNLDTRAAANSQSAQKYSLIGILVRFPQMNQ